MQNIDLSFEAALSELSNIIQSLEQSNVPLDELVSKYEQGHKLLNYCNSKLESAELKIQQLGDKNKLETYLSE